MALDRATGCPPRSRSSTGTLKVAFAGPRTRPRRSCALLPHHALRGYDAVHLACALQLHGDDILLATWDNSLNAAARATSELLANDTA